MLTWFTKVARKQATKLSVEKLKEKGSAWVCKVSIQGWCLSGAMKAKEKRRFNKQLPSWRFANHHPYSRLMHMWHSYPMVGMVISQFLILIIGIGLYIMEGYQIILLIDDFLCQERKYYGDVLYALWNRRPPASWAWVACLPITLGSSWAALRLGWRTSSIDVSHVYSHATLVDLFAKFWLQGTAPCFQQLIEPLFDSPSVHKNAILAFRETQWFQVWLSL